MRQCTQITTCVGIGHSKVQAKLANHIAKKNQDWGGVCNLVDLPSAEISALLAEVKASDIWGIGRKISANLQSMGIHTALQLRDADQQKIKQRFGIVVERICRELAGHSCLDFSDVAEPKKQIIRSRSFGQLVTDKTALQAAVSTHISSALEVLRKQNSRATIVSVFLDTNRFRQQDAQYHASQSAALSFPSADTLQFNQLAMTLLNQLYKSGYLYKKAGVMLAGIESSTTLQADLFAPKASVEREKLMQVIDSLNSKYGRGTVQLATAQMSSDWRMSRENLSPCYTTRVGELVSAG